MGITLTPTTVITGLVMALALGMFIWFFVGMQMNLARGNAALRWMKEGIQLLSEKTSLRWLGSSVVQMGMTAPRAPFKHIDILAMLEPRDVVFLWLASRRGGRRDALILRGDLRRAARCQFDVLDATSWSGKDALKHHTPPEWARETRDGLLFAAEDGAALEVARQILPLAQKMGGRLVRLSARQTVPHVEIHLLAPWQGSVQGTVQGKDALAIFRQIGEMLLPQQ
jgi:hypothetical protein